MAQCDSARESPRLLSFKIWTRDKTGGAGRARARLRENQDAENGVLRGREGTLEDGHNAIVEGDVCWTEEQEDGTRGDRVG